MATKKTAQMDAARRAGLEHAGMAGQIARFCGLMGLPGSDTPSRMDSFRSWLEKESERQQKVAEGS